MLVKNKAVGARHRIFLEEQRRSTERSYEKDTIAAKERELAALQSEHRALNHVQQEQQRTLDHLAGSRREGENGYHEQPSGFNVK